MRLSIKLHQPDQVKETQISSPHTLQTHTFRATQLEEGNVKSNLHLHVKFENSGGQRSMCKDGGRETMKPRQIISNSVKGRLPFHNKVEDHDRWNMKCQFRFSFKNGKWQKHHSYFFNLSPPSEHYAIMQILRNTTPTERDLNKFPLQEDDLKQQSYCTCQKQTIAQQVRMLNIQKVQEPARQISSHIIVY